jgi:cellulose synthase/poly-beta-1,6-N-acetylglucosamine synthase-like glycosyltransferase
MFASAQVKEVDSWQPGFSAHTAKLFAKAAGEKSTPHDLSVVVPCFNEEEGLFELHRRLTASCQKIGNYEVILVNDGSRDGTWPLMC